MKERELRKHAVCSLCKRRIGATGVPCFYRLTIERFGLILSAIQRQTGLEMVLHGHVGLAQAFSPDEEMATPLMEPLVLVVCEDCSMANAQFVARLAEIPSTVT